MDESGRTAVLDVLECLESLVHEGAQPGDAASRIETLRVRHPHTHIELVWQEEPFDESLHYDALVRAGGRDTVSLSVCRRGELPWPLRGVQRCSDADLLRVDGIVLRVADAIAHLDVLWQSDSLLQRLVDACLIEQAARELAVRVEPQEIQTALDSIRRRRGLHGAAETRAWMEVCGITSGVLEQMARDIARARKLKDLIVGDRARDYLATRPRDLDSIEMVQVHTTSRELASELAERVRSGNQTLSEVAWRAFLSGRVDEKCLQFRRVRPFELEQSLREALSSARAGDLVGPIAVDEHWVVVHVATLQEVGTEQGALAAAKSRLFHEWLEQRRRSAKIEWLWGLSRVPGSATHAPSPIPVSL
jgi:putative peptide maturation system protein